MQQTRHINRPLRSSSTLQFARRTPRFYVLFTRCVVWGARRAPDDDNNSCWVCRVCGTLEMGISYLLNLWLRTHGIFLAHTASSFVNIFHIWSSWARNIKCVWHTLLISNIYYMLKFWQSLRTPGPWFHLKKGLKIWIEHRRGVFGEVACPGGFLINEIAKQGTCVSKYIKTIWNKNIFA